MEGESLNNQIESTAYRKVVEALTLRLKECFVNIIRANWMEASLVSVTNESFCQAHATKGLYLPADFDSLVTIYQNNKEISRSLTEETRNDLNKLFCGQAFDLWRIREVALIFLKSVKNTNMCFLQVGSKVYDWLNDDHIILLANLVTAIYLETWLIEDEGTYQTPYGFLAHPYRAEDKLQKGKAARITDGENSKIQRAFKRYSTHVELRKWQIANEKTSPIIERIPSRKYGKPVDLIALAWCDAYINGGLDIIDYLFERNFVMTRAEDLRNKNDYGLSIACKNYQAYINQIDQLNTGDHAPVENNRRFVASSMMLHRIERVYGFHMQGRIAERRCQKSIDPRKYCVRNAALISGRYEDFHNSLFLPSWTAGKSLLDLIDILKKQSTRKEQTENKYVLEDARIEVLDIDFFINLMFCVEGDEQSNAECELHWQRRHLTRDLMIFLFTLFFIVTIIPLLRSS